MDTTEGNKLIAEFMELKQVNWYSPILNTHTLLWVNKKFVEDFTDVDNYSNESKFDWGNSLPQSEKLWYHSSWDWLMPVVEKIEHTAMYVTIKGCLVTASDIVDVSMPTKIEAAWTAVIEIIQWYNANK